MFLPSPAASVTRSYRNYEIRQRLHSCNHMIYRIREPCNQDTLTIRGDWRTTKFFLKLPFMASNKPVLMYLVSQKLSFQDVLISFALLAPSVFLLPVHWCEGEVSHCNLSRLEEVQTRCNIKDMQTAFFYTPSSGRFSHRKKVV